MSASEADLTIPTRQKRLSIVSVPATGIQPTTVMTRPKTEGEGDAKRFSLVMSLNGKGTTKDKAELSKGVAAGRLSGLLGKAKSGITL
jgi:hypothetical protein